MITNPFIIFLILLGIEGMILFSASHPRTRYLFRFLPAVFWIYFLPMIVSTLGWIDPKSPLYGWVTTNGLPACLFLLLLGVDCKMILRLGHKALLMFLIGSLGMMVGAVTTFAIFHPIIGDAFWGGFGALSASWIGGSANMVAAKEALGTPDDIFLPMVIVDTIVPYVWMGILVVGSTWQALIDRLNHADRTVLDEIQRRLRIETLSLKVTMSLWTMIAMVVMAFAVSFALKWLSGWLPVIPGIVSSLTWTIILVSIVGLGCSLTPLRFLEMRGSTKIGYALLYFVLTTIGAKASLSQLGTSLILIAAGFMIVAIHAMVLIITARLLRVPMMLAATASQANIGGGCLGPGRC